MMVRTHTWVTVLIAVCGVAGIVGVSGVAAQESDGEDPFGIDSLFEEDHDAEENRETEESAESEDSEAPEAPAEPASTVLDRVRQDEPVRMGANVRLVSGYSPGWTAPLGETGDYEDLSVVDLSSSIDLRLTVSPALTITQAFRFTYPDYEFELTKLALDYTIEDVAFLTAGLTRINWGRSPNFPFANVLHREADNPLSPSETQNNLVARLSVPIGVGGIDLIAINKDEYHEDPESPRADRIGFGAKYNLAQQWGDIDVGGYVQRGLSGRAFVSGSTTIFDWLELYGEGVIVDDSYRRDDTGFYADVDDAEEELLTTSGEPIKPGWVEIAPDKVLFDNNPDYGASLGVVIGLFQNSLELNGEYYYNGEETETEVDGGRFPLFWGHNLALNADYQIPQLPVRLRIAYRYSHTFQSTMLVPRLTIDPLRHVTFDVAGGFFWGRDDAGYRPENPDDLDRPTFLSFTVTINGKI